MEEVTRMLQELNTRLQEQEGRTQQLQRENAGLNSELGTLRASQGQTPAQPTRQLVGALVDTRVLGKPDHFSGDATKFADWSFKLKAYMAAIDHRYQSCFAIAESSAAPVLIVNLDPAEAALSTQLYYVLVMLVTETALNKCHNAGINEGFERWRQFVLEWEPRLQTRHVGLLMQVLSYQFDGELSNKLAAFERLITEYERQTTKEIDEDLKIGVAILGMTDTKVKEHLIRNAGRIDTWPKMREEIVEISCTTAYVNSQPLPMQLGATPKGKGKEKGKKRKGPAGEGQREREEPRPRQGQRTVELKPNAEHARWERDVRSRVLLLQEARPRQG